MPFRKPVFLCLVFILSQTPFLFSAEPKFETPVSSYFLGEVFTYKIQYLGVPVGESRSEIKEITEIAGRKAFHIEVHVKSYPLIDWIYKVRDEHHSYVDVKTLESLRYEKKIREGRRRAEEIIMFDPEKKTAHYLDPKGKTVHEMAVPEGVQDQLSCGYFARLLLKEPQTSLFIPVNADKQNWNLEVKVYETGPLDMDNLGKFEAVRIEPLMEFQGIFIRRGKAEGWIATDPKRIPLKMKVKIPVLGFVTAELIKYETGKENV